MFHKMFLNILITFLERCVDSGVLELFLSVFLIFLKTFHEHNVFLTCSYIFKDFLDSLVR